MPSVGLHRIGLAAWLLVAAAGLSGCAAPYQELTLLQVLSGGWSVQATDDDKFLVSYTGTLQTSRETLQTYWLYRAAELAIDRGATGFEILSDMDWVLVAPDGGGRVSSLAVTRPVAHRYVPPGLPKSAVEPPQVKGEIRLLLGDIEDRPPKVFVARRLLEALDPWVNGDKCRNGNVCPHDHWYLRRVPAPRGS